MAEKVSQFVVRRLIEWGVGHVFGYPGNGIGPLLGALEERRAELRFIQARHEELAAFMACAHAKFTGEVGVCIATSGAGAIHLLNGLYDAAMDHQPVVAIVGQQATRALGADHQQEVDLQSLFKDVAHHFCHTCMTPAQARHLIDRALRIAIAERVVTCVILPQDIQEMAVERSPARTHGTHSSGIGYRPPRVVPTDDELRRAAEVLNAGQRIAILAGAGALGASEELAEVAERLDAGVAKALLGRAVLPDDRPYVTGSIGMLGTRPSELMMERCDTLFMIGSSFPYAEWLPREGQARGVQIDLKPRMLSLRYPMEVNLCGDTRETLRALLPLLEERSAKPFQQEIASWNADWWALLEERAMSDADPIHPERVFWELSSQLPERVIVTADSGSAAVWWARDLKLRPGMMASLSGNLAAMGAGVPYALAAKIAHPDRPVIACVGDGAMQMNGINGLLPVADLWEEWDDPRFLVLVLNNRDLEPLDFQPGSMASARKEALRELPDFSYASYAELIGLRGVRMDHSDDVAPSWEEALAAKRPVVVEARTDPRVSVLPPHLRGERASRYGRALPRGEPAVWRGVKPSANGHGTRHVGPARPFREHDGLPPKRAKRSESSSRLRRPEGG